MPRATIRTRGPFSSLAQRMTPSQRHPATPPPLRRGLPQQDPGTILAAARRCGAPTDGSPQRQLWVRVQNDASPGRGDRIPVALATTEDLFAVHLSAAFHPRRPTTPRNPTIVLKLVLAPVYATPRPAWTLINSTPPPPVSPPSAPTLLPPSSSPVPGRTSAPLRLCGTTSPLHQGTSLPTSPPLCHVRL